MGGMGGGGHMGAGGMGMGFGMQGGMGMQPGGVPMGGMVMQGGMAPMGGMQGGVVMQGGMAQQGQMQGGGQPGIAYVMVPVNQQGQAVAQGAMVGRCKLDPSLKAPVLSNFDCENDNIAFDLKPPGFLSLHHYTEVAPQQPQQPMMPVQGAAVAPMPVMQTGAPMQGGMQGKAEVQG